MDIPGNGSQGAVYLRHGNVVADVAEGQRQWAERKPQGLALCRKQITAGLYLLHVPQLIVDTVNTCSTVPLVPITELHKENYSWYGVTACMTKSSGH